MQWNTCQQQCQLNSLGPAIDTQQCNIHRHSLPATAEYMDSITSGMLMMLWPQGRGAYRANHVRYLSITLSCSECCCASNTCSPTGCCRCSTTIDCTANGISSIDGSAGLLQLSASISGSELHLVKDLHTIQQVAQMSAHVDYDES